jgi:hypothetical protein
MDDSAKMLAQIKSISFYEDGLVPSSSLTESECQITDSLSQAFNLQLLIINKRMVLKIRKRP